ncbi:MAG: MFS transporter [Gemmataceae bacterium]
MTEHGSQEHRTRIIIAGIAGNVMEWYDFALYGYFAQIIGRHFFPSEDPTTSLIASFGAFAAGFLMRPVGAIFFGHIGDKLGRKSALTLSVLMMAIPTFVIGILPGHAQIGPLAAVLLVIMRMVQGLSVGGEYTTSIVFLVEGAPHGARGLAGSWSAFGAVAGALLGSAAGAVMSSVLGADALYSWGWRVPFLVGLGVGLVGLFIRRHIPEPQEVETDEPAVHEVQHSPVIQAFRTQGKVMAQVFGLNLLNAVGFYLIFVYAATYFTDVVHVSAREALDINTLNMIVLLLLVPTFGALSDRVGRLPVLCTAAAAIMLFSWPLFWLMHHQDDTLIFLGQLGFTILLGGFFGAIPVTMAEAFPPQVRCSGLSITYNLCLGVIGGTTPLVATYLIERTGDDLSPAFYIMGAAAITLGASLTLPRHALGSSPG